MSASEYPSEYPPKDTKLFNILSLAFIISAVVGSSGFEPPTLRLSGARSNHLSYEPIFKPLVVEMKGFEPLTPCLQGRCSPN